MKKIPTIFERDWNGDRSRVLNKPNHECEWVFHGEGVATRKWDGTAVMVLAGKLYCRFDAKNGKTPPIGFLPSEPAPDKETGHWPGWMPATSPQHKHQLAYFVSHLVPDGTYECCGPHFQGNPEKLETDVFLPHGNHKYVGVPTDFEGLKEFLEKTDCEGLVWWHPDGRKAKIKKKDFGLERH